MAASAIPHKRVHPVRSFLVGDEPMTTGLWGIIFIFSEIMFFAGLIAAMLALHSDTLLWEPTNGAHRVRRRSRPADPVHDPAGQHVDPDAVRGLRDSQRQPQGNADQHGHRAGRR